jgi:hypothetical protein
MRPTDFSLTLYLIINDQALEIEAVDAMLMKQTIRLAILPHAFIEFDLRGTTFRVNDSPSHCPRPISDFLTIHITIENCIAAVIVNITGLVGFVVDPFTCIETLEDSLIDLSMLDIAELNFVHLMTQNVHFFDQISEIHRFDDLCF